MKKLSKILATLITAAGVLGLIPITALADGSYWVGSNYVELHVGESTAVSVGADNAAGKIGWSSDGPVSANGSTWLDDSTDSISIYAESPGTGYVYVNPTDIATYDGEEISYGYTITVVVIGDEPQEDVTTTTQPAWEDEPEEPQDDDNEETTTTAEGEENTTEETTTEEETKEEAEKELREIFGGDESEYADLTDEEKLIVNMNDREYRIIQYPLMLDEAGEVVVNPDITGIEILEGFELDTVLYKGVDVDSFIYNKGELRVFVLENQETLESDYYTFDETKKEFKHLVYEYINQRLYIMLSLPKGFSVPEGYEVVDLTIGNCKVKALKRISAESKSEESETNAEEVKEEEPTEEQAEEVPADEENPVGDEASLVIDLRNLVTLKGYETLVSPGLESEDPSDDLYYIYCLVDGKKQLYCYDIAEGTLQRSALYIYEEVETEPETIPEAALIDPVSDSEDAETKEAVPADENTAEEAATDEAAIDETVTDEEAVTDEAVIDETSDTAEQVKENTAETEKQEQGNNIPEQIIPAETTLPAVPETTQTPGWAGIPLPTKTLLIALGVAIILIIILIIVCLSLGRRRKARNKRKETRNTSNVKPRVQSNNEYDSDEDDFFSYVKTEKGAPNRESTYEPLVRHNDNKKNDDIDIDFL